MDLPWQICDKIIRDTLGTYDDNDIFQRLLNQYKTLVKQCVIEHCQTAAKST